MWFVTFRAWPKEMSGARLINLSLWIDTIPWVWGLSLSRHHLEFLSLRGPSMLNG